MQAVDIEFVNGSRLVKEYLRGEEKASNYFPENLLDLDNSLKRILNEKSGRKGVDRKTFVKHLLAYHEKFDVGTLTVENILALENEDTLVVVSGQQAGLLTGPLYTIHKIITTIHLSREYTERLGRVVVPVFWIAGEDHDYLEVNHIHVLDGVSVQKKSYSEIERKKVMVSEIELKKDKMTKWVQSIFSSFGETDHTKELLSLIEDCISKSQTFSEFFANIIVTLFKEEGLVLYDSGDKSFRALQTPCFRQIIERNEELVGALQKTQEELIKSDYALTLAIKEDAAHLFYELNGERVLLSREEEGFRVGDTNVVFSKNELLDEVTAHPEKFSNNVVTRPIMQEWLFPTLFFVGGPGELAYWGELKKVFNVLDVTMPIVYPRISMTIIERNVAYYMDKLSLTYHDVFANRVKEKKQAFLTESLNEPIDELFMEVSDQLQNIHKQLQSRVSIDFPQLVSFGGRNEVNLIKELSIYKKQVEKEMHRKHEVVLKQYQVVENHLYPLNAGQERMLNVFYFLNIYGVDFVNRLVDLDMPKTFQHKLIIM